MIPTVPFTPPEPEPTAPPPAFPATAWRHLPEPARIALREWYDAHRAHLLHTLYNLLLSPNPPAAPTATSTQPTGAQLGCRLLLLGYLLRIDPLAAPGADTIRRAWHLSRRDFDTQKLHLQRLLRRLNPRLPIRNSHQSRNRKKQP